MGSQLGVKYAVQSDTLQEREVLIPVEKAFYTATADTAIDGTKLEGKLDNNLAKTLPGQSQSVGNELSGLKLNARVASTGDELVDVRNRYLEVAAAAKAAGMEARAGKPDAALFAPHAVVSVSVEGVGQNRLGPVAVARVELLRAGDERDALVEAVEALHVDEGEAVHHAEGQLRIPSACPPCPAQSAARRAGAGSRCGLGWISGSS